MPIRDIAIAVLVTAVWGFNFVIIRWGVEEVPPLFLTVLRFAASAFPAIFFVTRPTSRWPTLALYGLTMGSIQFGLLFVAMKLGFSASLSSLVMQLQAFFTMALAAVFLHDRPRPVQIAGAIACLFRCGADRDHALVTTGAVAVRARGGSIVLLGRFKYHFKAQW